MIFGRDIWFIILHELPLEDLFVFSFISKQMKAFCHDDYFWAIKFAKTGWTIPPSLLKRYPNISMKNLDDVKDKLIGKTTGWRNMFLRKVQNLIFGFAISFASKSFLENTFGTKNTIFQTTRDIPDSERIKELLLEYFIHPDRILNPEGFTLLECALIVGDKKLANVLLSFGAAIPDKKKNFEWRGPLIKEDVHKAADLFLGSLKSEFCLICSAKYKSCTHTNGFKLPPRKFPAYVSHQ